MSDIKGDDAITVTISGNISVGEISDILKQHFGNRNITVNDSSKPGKSINFDSGDILLSSSPYQQKEETSERELLWLRNKQTELEKTTAIALDSAQTFQRQHQALYDHFVSLRALFDEQKLSLLNTLWIHCGTYHPELREIPVVEDMSKFKEAEDRVGEFSVGETLGQGQFATVKSCLKDGTRSELAVKIIKKDRFITFGALKRISNEIEILRKLKSEFIVSVKHVVQTTDNLYIVTEKGGKDLFEYFEDDIDGIPESWARDIIICCLKAILYCHDREICHRDLKPENILLTFDKETGKCVNLKLCDFGLSTRFSSTRLLTDFCGSPGFFAPEMIMTGSYEGDKADVWSTGCILLELLFGRRRFIDVWMTPYEYEVMQNKEAFGKEMLETVTKLPQDLTFSPEFNDFIIQLLVLDREYRPKTRDICSHPWLEGSFDSLIASKHNLKHRSKHRPSINEALNQTSFDAAAASASARSNNLGLVRLDSTDGSVADNGHATADDSSSNSIGQKRPLTVPLPRLSKEKSPLSTLEVEDCNVTISRSPSKNKGESPRGTSSILLCKKTLGSPSSSGVHGDEYGSSSTDNTDGPADPVVRANMILPPIGDRLTSRNQDGMSYSMQDEDEQVDADNCAYNPQSLMNAAISSLSKGGSRRMDLCHSPPLTQSSPLDPECSSGGNSCNSAGSGVSFFGYGNRQYSAPRGSFANELSAPRGSFANDFSAPRGSFANDFSAPRGSFANDFSALRGSFANDFSAPRGSFANDFSAPRGSFANDAYTNPRGSFMSDCGTGPRSSFFNENSRASNNHMTRSMSSSVTASPTGATPLATPSTSNTPTLRNIDEESDETNIDELRNFLSGSGFSFLGTK